MYISIYERVQSLFKQQNKKIETHKFFNCVSEAYLRPINVTNIFFSYFTVVAQTLDRDV